MTHKERLYREYDLELMEYENQVNTLINRARKIFANNDYDIDFEIGMAGTNIYDMQKQKHDASEGMKWVSVGDIWG